MLVALSRADVSARGAVEDVLAALRELLRP